MRHMAKHGQGHRLHSSKNLCRRLSLPRWYVPFPVICTRLPQDLVTSIICPWHCHRGAYSG